MKHKTKSELKELERDGDYLLNKIMPKKYDKDLIYETEDDLKRIAIQNAIEECKEKNAFIQSQSN